MFFSIKRDDTWSRIKFPFIPGIHGNLDFWRDCAHNSTGDMLPSLVHQVHPRLAGTTKYRSLRCAAPPELLWSVSPELQTQKRSDGKRSRSLCFAACTSRRTEKAIFPVKKERRPATAHLTGLASSQTTPCRRSKAAHFARSEGCRTTPRRRRRATRADEHDQLRTSRFSFTPRGRSGLFPLLCSPPLNPRPTAPPRDYSTSG
jgi:hypothetical protein